MRFLLALLLLLVATTAQAQEGPGVDPRLAGYMVQALQGQLALAQAVLKTRQDDQAKRDADLAEWFKGWFGDKPAQ